MKSIVLERKEGYGYKGVIFFRGQVNMVSDDFATYLLAQRDEQDVPYFKEVASTTPAAPKAADVPEAPAADVPAPGMSYEELKAACTAAGIEFRGNASKKALQELLDAKALADAEAAKAPTESQEATADPVTIAG